MKLVHKTLVMIKSMIGLQNEDATIAIFVLPIVTRRDQDQKITAHET